MDRGHAEYNVMPNTDNNAKSLIRKPFVTFQLQTPAPRRPTAAGATTCADATSA